MPSGSTAFVLGGIVAGLVFVGLIVRHVRRAVVQIRSDRALRARARQREILRRPVAGTLVLEGRVVAHPEERSAVPCDVVTRRQFGCLGGPIVHDVPPFVLETDAGERLTVELGDDPVIENLQLLPENRPAGAGDSPPSTGAPDSVRALRGRVRVAGVAVAEGGRMAAPSRHSAILTILRD
jgi:hypothetical protein